MRLGLGLSLTSLRGGVSTFSIASLLSNASGLWGDNTDTPTLFTDTAGTTPVTATGQTVALALDKSEGAGFSGGSFTGLGTELVTNGGFDTDVNGWTAGNNATLAHFEGRLSITGSFGYAAQSLSTTPGNTYLIYFDVFSDGVMYEFRAGTSLGEADFLRLTSNPSSGFYVFVALTSTTYIQPIVYQSGETSSIEADNISVRELPGNHRTQSGSSFRPQYQTGGLLYDGTDDRLTSSLKPTTSGTIAARFNGDTASRVILGSQAASDGRAFLALDASGRIGAGIGSQSTSTIVGGSDLRSSDHTGAVTWDGSTVKLYLDGTEVYSAAQSGAVNATVSFMEGALNANGTAAAFWDGTISDTLVLDRVATPEEITNLHNEWSA